jgi:hypothetical protein
MGKSYLTVQKLVESRTERLGHHLLGVPSLDGSHAGCYHYEESLKRKFKLLIRWLSEEFNNKSSQLTQIKQLKLR